MSALEVTNTGTFLTSVSTTDVTVPMLNQTIRCNQDVVYPGGRCTFTIPKSTGLMVNAHLVFTTRTTYPFVGQLPTVGGSGWAYSNFENGGVYSGKAYQVDNALINPAQAVPALFRPDLTGPAQIEGLVPAGLTETSTFRAGVALATQWKSLFNKAQSSALFNFTTGAALDSNPYFNNPAYPYDAFYVENGRPYPHLKRCQNYNYGRMAKEGIYTAVPNWGQLTETPYTFPQMVLFAGYSGSQPQYATDLGLGGYLNLFTQMDITRSDGTIISQLNNQNDYATINWLQMLTMPPTEAKLYDMKMGCGIYHLADTINADSVILPGAWATDKCASYELAGLDSYGLATADSTITLIREITMPLVFPLTKTWPISQFCGEAVQGEANASVEMSATFAPFDPYMWTDRPKYYSGWIDSLEDAPTNQSIQTNSDGEIDSSTDVQRLLYKNSPAIREIQWIPLYPSLFNALPSDTSPSNIPGPLPINIRSGNVGCILRVNLNSIRLSTADLESVLGKATLALGKGVLTGLDGAYNVSYPMCPLYGGFTIYPELEYLDGPVGSDDRSNLIDNKPLEIMQFNSICETIVGRRILRHEKTAVWVDGNNISSIQLESRHTESFGLTIEDTVLNYDEREPTTRNVVIRLARTVTVEVPVHGAYYGQYAGFESFNCQNTANAATPAFPQGVMTSTCATQVPSQYFFTLPYLRSLTIDFPTLDNQSNPVFAFNCRPHFKISLLLATQSPAMSGLTLQGEVPACLTNQHMGYGGNAAPDSQTGYSPIGLIKDPKATDTDDVNYDLGTTRPIPRMIYPTEMSFSNIQVKFQKATVSLEHEQLLDEETASENGLRIQVPFFTQTNVPVIPSNMPIVNFTPTQQQIYGMRFAIRSLNERDVYGVEPGLGFCGFQRVELTRGAVKVWQKEAWELTSRIGTDYPVSMPSWNQFNDENWIQNPFVPRKGCPTDYDVNSVNRFVGAMFGANPLNGLNNAKETNLTLLERTQSYLDLIYTPTRGGAAYVEPGTTFTFKGTLQKDYESCVVTPIYLLGHLQKNINQASLNTNAYKWLGAGTGNDELNKSTNYVRFWNPAYTGTDLATPPTLIDEFMNGRPSWNYAPDLARKCNGMRFTTPFIDGMVHVAFPYPKGAQLYCNQGFTPATTLLTASATGLPFLQKLADLLAVVGCQQVVNVGDCSLFSGQNGPNMLNLQITVFHTWTTVIKKTSIGQGAPTTTISFLS